MQQGWNTKIKNFSPMVILHSLKESFVAVLGVLLGQLSLNGKVFSNVKTVKYTIGGVGVADCDFNFATASNQNEQVINLGAIVPAYARVLDVRAVVKTTFTGAVSLAAEIGNTSSGHEYVNSGSILTAAERLSMAADHLFTVVPDFAATAVYVSCTPGANWSLVTAGKIDILITYIEAF
jgi:hypothetical protein